MLIRCTGTAPAQNAALLAEGHWQEAARRATALGIGEGYALGAEALTSGGALVSDNQKKAIFQQAQEQAQRRSALHLITPKGISGWPWLRAASLNLRAFWRA
ncbi:hypothetical protein GCM10008949_53110 [Deinococcus humi]|nr:hypothetical protein GCM10008949_53110 [Deinococcus humi]